jgi:hypothetical protein
MRRAQRILATLVITAASLAIPEQFALAAQDQPASHLETPRSAANLDFNFLIGSGLLCDSNASTSCPVLARAGTGETIEISGAGTLYPAQKSVSAAGAFSERLPSGIVVTTGVWTATQLVSFESYGFAPRALQVDYPNLKTLGAFSGSPAPNPLASLLSGPMPAGGVATIRIQLLPDLGATREAVLQITCAKGQPPPDVTDGVRVTLAGSGPEFDEVVSGRALFFLRLPDLKRAWAGGAVAEAAP